MDEAVDQVASHEHLDVLIVGAGLSGISAAYHLQTACPDRSYAVLEARDDLGGTWDLFRYPGIRSDSDMYTLGYSWKPWKDPKAIADGPAILAYIREAATENGIDRRIRFRCQVVRASWSSAESRWTVEVRERGAARVLTCGFLFMCSGYYDYEAGYTPELAGRDLFRGVVVHPQRWTPDVEYEGKKVVVIGSGATAVTLVPELAKRAAKVTMLQRSPSYVASLPARDRVATALRARVPGAAYALTRWKNVAFGFGFYTFCKRYPARAKRLLIDLVRKELRGAVDVDKHFTPTYDPWDQRVCVVPNGDLFEALRSGRADVVTDHIETFTETGLRLRSGAELEADLVVTATGLQLKFGGGVELVVDGRRVEPRETMTYKGMMCSDVPNLALAIGYTNASWTLKCDLTCEFVCRVLNTMRDEGHTRVLARRPGPHVKEAPAIDFTSGYVLRSIDQFPRQGTQAPWKLYQNYPLDLVALRHAPLKDGTLEFS